MDLEQIDLNALKAITTSRKSTLEFMAAGSEKIIHPDLWRLTRAIFDYVRVYKEIPSKETLIEQAGRNAQLVGYIEKSYAKFEGVEYDTKNFPWDLGKLKKRYQQNLIERMCQSLEQETDHDKRISQLKTSLTSIREVEVEQVYARHTLKEGIENFVERFKFRKANPDAARGTFSGFTALDYITTGFKTPEYILCCGSSGAGKSTLMMSLAVNMFLGSNTIDSDKFLSQGQSVVYYSLEIPFEECFDKLVSFLSKIPLRTIQSTELTGEQHAVLNKTLKFIKNYPYEFIIVDIPKGATASQMENIYRDYADREDKNGDKIKVIVVDYLGLMESDETDASGDQDWLRQEAISEQLYKFCRVNELILITGVQLNEPGPPKAGQNQEMGVHRLARSKGIIRPATLCLMLEKRPEEESYPNMPCWIIKNRRGPLGKFSLRKSFETCAFINDQGFSEDADIGPASDDISLALKKIEEENED